MQELPENAGLSRERNGGRPPTIADSAVLGPADRIWVPMGTGVERTTLLKDPSRDFSVMLLRFEAGATAVRHVHPLGEQFYVIEGSVEDAGGRYGAGTFVNQPPGSVHAPTSPDGATVLVTWFGRLDAY